MIVDLLSLSIISIVVLLMYFITYVVYYRNNITFREIVLYFIIFIIVFAPIVASNGLAIYHSVNIDKSGNNLVCPKFKKYTNDEIEQLYQDKSVQYGEYNLIPMVDDPNIIDTDYILVPNTIREEGSIKVYDGSFIHINKPGMYYFSLDFDYNVEADIDVTFFAGNISGVRTYINKFKVNPSGTISYSGTISIDKGMQAFFIVTATNITTNSSVNTVGTASIKISREQLV